MQRENATEDLISDINIKTINYIKKCKKQKPSRNISATKRYLKKNNLLAVPFAKKHTKKSFLSFSSLDQFEKIVPERKNAKHPHFTEEERVVEKMKELKTEGKISKTLFEEMVPVKGLHTQPARLYGLAKVHKLAKLKLQTC